MIFSSYEFIFYFLPIVIAVYFILCKFRSSWAKIWLILASFYFYAQGSAWFLPHLAAATLFNFGAGRYLSRMQESTAAKKRLLFLGILANVLLLGYYKYTDFFIYSFNRAFSLHIPAADILLPIGLSFLTFQLISYLVDSYRGKTGEYGFLDYLVFVAFFPRLLIGPIIRHWELMPDFFTGRSLRFNGDNFRRGLFIFSIGCAKKVLLADPLLVYTHSVFQNPEAAAPIALWIGMLANIMAIYFDFSGYTDMAIGLGYFFNLKLPENFDSPYRARNIQQYWRKWHMSLTRFLNEFIFNNIYKPGMGTAWFCFGIMVTFFISGFWHGAGWTFIFWGILHGTAVCIVVLLSIYYPKKHFLPKKPAQALTLLFLMFTGALFVSRNMTDFIIAVKGMFNWQYYSAMGYSMAWAELQIYFSENITVMAVLAICCYIVFFQKTTQELAKDCLTNSWYPLYAAMLLVLSFFFMGTVSTFFYATF